MPKTEATTYTWQVTPRGGNDMVITAESLALNADGTLVFTSGGVITNVINVNLYSHVVKN